jgi:hypothetical protein
VEIDQQADGNVEQFHVTQKLRFVNGKTLLNAFGFDQDASFDTHVKSQRFFAREALVIDDNRLLANAIKFAQTEFLRFCKSICVNGFLVLVF